MSKTIRNRYIFALETILLLLSPSIAIILRTDRIDSLTQFQPDLAIYTVGALLLRTILNQRHRLYSRYWRYASVADLVQIVQSNALATGILLIITTIGLTAGLITLPRSLPIIDGLLALLIIGGLRFGIRAYSKLTKTTSTKNRKRVAIMGAGDAGALIAREILNTPQLGMEVVGFFDDNESKHDMQIHGIPVVGGQSSIEKTSKAYGLQEIIVAIPSASGKELRQIVKACEASNLTVKTMPGIYSLIDGSVSVNQLRNVEIEDLLRRDPVQTDIESVQNLIKDQCVLVTGGGGSIGSELCRQIWRCEPRQLVIVGHGENSIFDIHNELRRIGHLQGIDVETRIKAVLLDTRFPKRVEQIVDRFKPTIIFHAAAHKHVPLMEMNPAEAITNNVLGTKNLLNAAVKADVPHFVMISTDKAVNPTNVMGASKRAAELLVHQAAERSGNAYVAVRFGNVLGSRGSVIHTFRRQIASGGPVTVTHQDMVRFFMTIPEAVQLVLQAAVLGTGGQVFVLDMGEPVKIMDLARDLITLSGFEVGRDIDIHISGIRPGEKLFEELFIEGEDYKRTQHDKIFTAQNAGALVPELLNTHIAALLEAADEDDRTAIMHGFKALIPEFAPLDYEFDATFSPLLIQKSGNGYP